MSQITAPHTLWYFKRERGRGAELKTIHTQSHTHTLIQRQVFGEEQKGKQLFLLRVVNRWAHTHANC